jgi:serralysin
MCSLVQAGKTRAAAQRDHVLDLGLHGLGAECGPIAHQPCTLLNKSEQRSLLNLAKEELMSTAFRAILEGSQEVPPNQSTASGLGTFTFDSAAEAADYSFRIEGVDYGPATGEPPQTPETLDDVVSTHFHNEARGANGPVVFGQINPAQDDDDLAIVQNEDGSWTVSGRWETTDPANVSIADFATALDSAAVGSEVPLYFNIHTTQFPMGEIRGQLVAIADDNNNVVEGTDGDDVLPGLGGDDMLTGSGGADTFAFAGQEFGADTITDFEDGTDKIQLPGEADAIEDRDNGAVITFGNGTVLVAGVNAADLNADDFVLG